MKNINHTERGRKLFWTFKLSAFTPALIGSRVHATRQVVKLLILLIKEMVAEEGLEPPTQGL